MSSWEFFLRIYLAGWGVCSVIIAVALENEYEGERAKSWPWNAVVLAAFWFLWLLLLVFMGVMVVVEAVISTLKGGSKI